MNQYYRVYAAIDLDAVCHNISEIKKLVGPDTKIMPVIKADGYGHGAVPVAKALNKIGVDGFAVAHGDVYGIICLFSLKEERAFVE